MSFAWLQHAARSAASARSADRKADQQGVVVQHCGIPWVSPDPLLKGWHDSTFSHILLSVLRREAPRGGRSSRFRSSRPRGFTGTRVARLPVGGKSLRGKSLRLVWACCRVCSAPGRARGYQTSKTTTPMHVARTVGRKGGMMMLMREGAREAAMMIGVDGRRRRHSSAALSTYPRRTRDVGGARTRGRGRHRPPGGHRVALRLERERTVDEHEKWGENAVRTPRQNATTWAEMGA